MKNLHIADLYAIFAVAKNDNENINKKDINFRENEDRCNGSHQGASAFCDAD